MFTFVFVQIVANMVNDNKEKNKFRRGRWEARDSDQMHEIRTYTKNKSSWCHDVWCDVRYKLKQSLFNSLVSFVVYLFDADLWMCMNVRLPCMVLCHTLYFTTFRYNNFWLNYFQSSSNEHWHPLPSDWLTASKCLCLSTLTKHHLNDTSGKNGNHTFSWNFTIHRFFVVSRLYLNKQPTKQINQQIIRMCLFDANIC